jgi:hypothetical protein
MSLALDIWGSCIPTVTDLVMSIYHLHRN